MNIQLYIERLILEGIDLDFADRHQLETAVLAEITQQLQGGGLEGVFENGRALANVAANPITLPENQGANGLGQEIGRAVYGAVRGGQQR